jgi:hypothetical protein
MNAIIAVTKRMAAAREASKLKKARQAVGQHGQHSTDAREEKDWLD